MMKHLHPRTEEFVLSATNEDRISATKKIKWIGYSHAQTVLERLNDLLVYPQTHRMPNMLLVGDSNNGKTALLRKFEKQNQSYFDEENVELVTPVLMIQSPPEPDEKRFYNIILESIFAPYQTTEKVDKKEQRVIHLLKKLKVKVLIIDEIHHVLAGTMQKQRLFLNVLKYLSNELKISMVCAGTRDAFNAIQTDPQLANRFEPKILPRWSFENTNEYLRLLASFERILMLKKPSNLTENSIATKILSMSDGLIGEIATILERATILAINSGIEKINNNILENIDFVSPTERKKMINRIY